MNKYDNNLTSINFLTLYSKLIELKPNIEISYLTVEEIIKVKNFPIKEQNSLDILPEDIKQLKKNNGICLVLLTAEEILPVDGQYIYPDKEIINKLNLINEIQYKEVWYLNKKMSTVTAGLGQYGKNQLIYNKKFGFNHNIRTFLIYNPVTNLLSRDKANYNIMNMCKDCNECEKNCPAHAINCSDYPFWLNEQQCRDFYSYGEHPTIPSLKYGINTFLNHPYSDEELKKVTDAVSFKKLFKFENRENRVNLNGKTYIIDIDFCKECMNQKPCRKKEYIYDKNLCKIVNEKPYDPFAIY